MRHPGILRISSLVFTCLYLFIYSSALTVQAQDLAEFARTSEGVPVVWQATVSGDFNAQLHGWGRIYKLHDVTGEYRIAIHLRDDTDQIHNLPPRGGGGLFIDGWFTDEPTGGAVRLDIGPFETPAVQRTRGKLFFETRRRAGESSTFNATSGHLSVVSYEPDFQARFSAELEGPIREGRTQQQVGIPQSWEEVRRRAEAEPPAERQRAQIRGRICQVAAEDEGATWGQVVCLESEEMRVVETMPGNRRDNVLPDRPPVYITFSDPVDPLTLHNNITLRTRSNDGQDIAVSGHASIVTDHKVLFEPDSQLLTGVVYEARVRGGDSGVRSRDGAVLAMDHTWRFSTVLVLADQRIQGKEPLEMDVYQTVRNVALIPGKPTLNRVSVNWRLREDVHRDWQPQEFRMTFRPSHEFRRVHDNKGRPHAGADSVRVRRPDLFDGDDRRFARNTVNFFGWRPEAGTSSISMEVEPFDPYPNDMPSVQPLLASRSVSVHSTAPTLNFAYTFLRVGAWADGISPQELQQLHETIPHIETLSTQLLPVATTRGRYFENDVQPPEDVSGTVRVLSQMMRRLHDEGEFRRGEIIVAFHPDAFRPGGLAVSELPSMDEVSSAERERWRVYRNRTVTHEFNPSYPATSVSMGVVHEFLHTLGFRHVPEDLREGEGDCSRLYFVREHPQQHRAQRRLPEITGFRLDQEGLTGWNKSSEDGNAESQLPLVHLMWPCTVTDERIWLPTSDYERIDQMVRDGALN